MCSATGILYVLFFASGAAALIYQVAWVRSLSLVFGGSHLAITTVLAVFMGGMALGSAIFGKRADRTARPLRLYGALELGIAASALAFMALVRWYPVVYGPVARLAGNHPVLLSAVRVVFAASVMLAPTTLMGGTLPVLSRFTSRRAEALGRHLSFLYGFNTLGAVAGAFVAGFALLRTFGVTTTVVVALALNVIVGVVAFLFPETPTPAEDSGSGREEEDAPAADPAERLAHRLVLWGIGVSGFCALGYEVLWTRMLSMVLGTSTYSFTVMLTAFLSGIAAGSTALGLVARLRRGSRGEVGLAAFGAVQILIGVVALAVTLWMKDLPTHAMVLQSAFGGTGLSEFALRQGASFVVAFAYMFVPAFFMGVAFPAAGTIHASLRKRVGGAVGEVLTYNTLGAIAGSASSGFVLIYVFGIERSLQLLAALNAGVGMAICASATRRRAAVAAVGAAVAAGIVALALTPGWGKTWDLKYFAIFRNTHRNAFDSPFKREDALQNTEVLYYHQGANETISVIKPRGGARAFVVNGRPEATTTPGDVQCQRTLGHLPMLLHPNPRSVFVLGTGSGMTLGATSIHPEVERIVLAEIEPSVLGATRKFGDYNHHVLDNPKLQIVFNDGRNYLATTDQKFDVITADPIHPWSGGAAYLYTTEYFRTVSEHLAPGGVACQWLPIYELKIDDVKTVLRTFAQNFEYVAVWLTHWDAELIGSNSPIVLDEEALARRISAPAIRKDLEAVQMGSAEAFLSYFVLGTRGVAEYGRGAVVNTDDNLFLEFSSPESMGKGMLMGDNVQSLGAARESIVPYLRPSETPRGRDEQLRRWARNDEAAKLHDRAHALVLWGRTEGPEFQQLHRALSARHPDFAPFQFTSREYRKQVESEPWLSTRVALPVAGARALTVSAVGMRMGEESAAVVFVDNERRVLFGQRYFDGDYEALPAIVNRYAVEVASSIRAAHARALEQGGPRAGAELSEAAAVTAIKDGLRQHGAEVLP